MTDTEPRGAVDVPTSSPSAASPPEVELLPLAQPVMQALADGDAASAARIAGTDLGAWLASEDCTWLWRIRLEQARRHPESAHWFARAVLHEGRVVGHGGFHGTPDDRGMVEMGYAVDPAERRRGYGRAIVHALLAWAEREPAVAVVRAAISPTNHPSLRTIAGLGFEEIGEQWDEDDGAETLFERRLR